MMNIERLSGVKARIKKEEGMNTNVDIFATEKLISDIKKDRTLQQAINASKLPHIAGNVVLMPDAHEGYGFPIGGVIAFEENGIVSPGIVGFDINCGMRLLKTSLETEEIKDKKKELAEELFKAVPSGVGSRLKLRLSEKDLEGIAAEGAEYMISKGFGSEKDKEFIEEEGRMEGAFVEYVSSTAKKRGLDELGTLGAGNHFLEVQKVEKIYDERIAKTYGLKENQVIVMFHTGSRGFGHQVCTDYLMKLREYRKRKGIEVPDPELTYAFVEDKEAEEYLGAMRSAINFAFANRQTITHNIRKVFEKVFRRTEEELGMEILYDLAHNIAKLEEHTVNGSTAKVYVHRKGATRAFPEGSAHIPKKYRSVGQPILIPGSMGTYSYVLCGMKGSMQESFGSACHGAGRVMSRHQALRQIPAERTFSSLSSKGIEIKVRTKKLISEEAEWAYKDVDEVVKIVEMSG
ncbi:MAG: RtcB family protein, partial [Candidatus Micrarchaeaceae archaeon]